jgi:hypothetical protein
VSIVGELDIYNNKLYVELHSFDFLSLNTSQKTSNIQQPSRTLPTSTTSSQKRSLMYDSLFQNPPTTTNTTPTAPKKRKRSDNNNPTSPILEKSTSPNEHDANSLSTVDNDHIQEESSKPKEKPIKQEKRQLRSNPPKKIANIASTKLNLLPHNGS